MTFLSDLWKKFNAPVPPDSDVAVIEKKALTAEEMKESVFRTYVEAETEYLNSEDILEHLVDIKSPHG